MFEYCCLYLFFLLSPRAGEKYPVQFLLQCAHPLKYEAQIGKPFAHIYHKVPLGQFDYPEIICAIWQCCLSNAVLNVVYSVPR